MSKFSARHFRFSRCFSSFNNGLNTKTHYPIQSSTEIRESFLNYFQSGCNSITPNHVIYPSSSLIPSSSDRSLLFTSAGMVQFKDEFCGLKPVKDSSICTIQRCLRAGGKHNDLDNVGFTARHHTLFEMLGNFSFNGSYSKLDAMKASWYYLTQVLKLPQNRLKITVFQEDKESYELWRSITQWTDTDRIEFRSAEDNYWSMGDIGPCGPCTEIYYKQDNIIDDSEWLEIWNIVFMQEQKDSRGNVTKLPKVCIDTGMGLERLAAVLQGVQTNFDTDLFLPLIRQTQSIMLNHNESHNNTFSFSGLDRSLASTAFKVISDHFRAICFLISDGVLPSNIGRGYVLRRIIRRAMKFAVQIGITKPFLNELYPALIMTMGKQYPQLMEREKQIKSIIEAEETIFLSLLQRGLKLLDSEILKNKISTIIPGSLAFQLYDAYGFPLDLTELIARERKLKVDNTEFDRLMQQQKTISKTTWIGSEKGQKVIENMKKWQQLNIQNQFTGYDNLVERNVKILSIQAEINTEADNTDTINDIESAYWICIDRTPFYSLGGGQTADTGTLTINYNGVDIDYTVTDSVQIYQNCSAIKVIANSAESRDLLLKASNITTSNNYSITATVNASLRAQIAVHHTATHLLHSAINEVLSPLNNNITINQAGSAVLHDRLRFDFTFPKALTPVQISAIENSINSFILQHSDAISIQNLSLAEAQKLGAKSLFTEKYGNTVRVVSVGAYSIELCGGTHTNNIKSIYPFKILNDSGLSAGIRRIEAIAGITAIQYLLQIHIQLKNLASNLAIPIEQVENRVKQLKTKLDTLEDTVKQLKKQEQHHHASNTNTDIIKGQFLSPINQSSTSFHLRILHDSDHFSLDNTTIREFSSELLKSDASIIYIFYNVDNGYIMITSNSEKNQGKIKANELFQYLAKKTGLKSAKGGGNANLAQGKLIFTDQSEAETIKNLTQLLG